MSIMVSTFVGWKTKPNVSPSFSESTKEGKDVKWGEWCKYQALTI